MDHRFCQVARAEGEDQEQGAAQEGVLTPEAFPTSIARSADQIVDLISRITPTMGRDEEAETAKDDLVRVVMQAWVQEPMQELVDDPWDKFGESNI
ncbi:MAG: hypothetical protein R3F39_23435 [Myxococcota bacterium]